MKKLTPRLLTVLCLTLLFLVGCDWLLRTSDYASALLGIRTEWTGWHSLLSPIEQWLVTIALILLPILTLASWLLVGRDNSIRTLTASGDVIRLTPQAIERVICREVRNNVAEVMRVGAVARQGKKGPSVVVNVATSDNAPVPQVDADVRRETVKVLQHLLGVGDPSEVKIVVYDVQSPSAKANAKRRRAVESAQSDPAPHSGKSRDVKPTEPAGVSEKPKALPPPKKDVEKKEVEKAFDEGFDEMFDDKEAMQKDAAKPAMPFPPKSFEAEAAAKPFSAPKAFDAESSKDIPPPTKS